MRSIFRIRRCWIQLLLVFVALWVQFGLKASLSFGYDDTLLYEGQIIVDSNDQSRWKVERELGQGGYGYVYEVSLIEDPRNPNQKNERFALKVFKRNQPQAPKRKNETTRDIQTEARRILKDYFDSGKARRLRVEKPKRVFQLETKPETKLNASHMEIMGKSLFDAGGDFHFFDVQRNELLSQNPNELQRRFYRVLETAVDLFDGLDELHRLGLVHSDIKPANILKHPSEDGRVMISDFDSVQFPQSRTSSISLKYSSPELQTAHMDPTKNFRLNFASDRYSAIATIRDLILKSFQKNISSITRDISPMTEPLTVQQRSRIMVAYQADKQETKRLFLELEKKLGRRDPRLAKKVRVLGEFIVQGLSIDPNQRPKTLPDELIKLVRKKRGCSTRLVEAL